MAILILSATELLLQMPTSDVKRRTESTFLTSGAVSAVNELESSICRMVTMSRPNASNKIYSAASSYR